MLGWPQPKNSYTADVVPTTTDNLMYGYEVGSEWAVAGTTDLYKCMYSDRSTATWKYVAWI